MIHKHDAGSMVSMTVHEGAGALQAYHSAEGADGSVLNPCDVEQTALQKKGSA
jgi:hypothetical protein